MSGTAVLDWSQSGDQLDVVASGEWTAEHAAHLEELVRAVEREPRSIGRVAIDLRHLDRLDTFGAWLLERLAHDFGKRGCETTLVGLQEKYRSLISELGAVTEADASPPRRPHSLLRALASMGMTVSGMADSIWHMVDMLGRIVTTALAVLLNPTRFRFTSTIHHLERVGWRAVPIILLIMFLIGAIIAQQGLFHFRKFGADIFVVDMVGVLVLREVGVLIVCIMVAGRSGSAYTAELGTMKMREEIDALQTMGLDPTEVLILPRILALLIAVPALTFIGSMAALYGGGLVCWLYGGIDPEVFLQRLRESISIAHFEVGMTKSPFMALIIGLVACTEGLQVKGSAQSLGQQTTASVVKSIFLVIVMDGLFAILFAAIGK